MKLTARDPGAPADIPAWCRMTGHILMNQTHPVYLIQRKES
jgi:tRNA 2-thiouridine synthesizing protein A